MTIKVRNEAVDILRGFAMLLVVLGHTMTGSTIGAEDTLMFNFIWSVQMPLFFTISGYVTKYSPVPDTPAGLAQRLKRRTAAYLLPWAVWSFLIRGVLLGETAFLDVKHLLWHMDSGYWFLSSIWTISVVFAAAQFAASRFGSDSRKYWLALGGGYVLGMVLLLGVGSCMGITFWNLKQTLYYMLFFAFGTALGVLEPWLEKHSRLAGGAALGAAAAYAVMLLMTDLYRLPDGITGILLRGAAGVFGCICLIFAVKYIYIYISSENLLLRGLIWIGNHSLGIYVVHTIILHKLELGFCPAADSFLGIVIVLAKAVAATALSACVSWLLDQNPVVRKLCLGR